MKVRNTLLLAGGLLLLSACNESEYELGSLVPEQYHKILYVNNSGKQEVALYKTGEDNVYEFSIFKSGSEPNSTASADVEVLTQEELDSEYSNPEAVNYKLISADCYSIEMPHVEFSAEERYKSVSISLSPDKVESIMESGDEDAKWVLPLRITSENDSVNNEKDELFLQITGVVTPSLGFESSAVSIADYSYNTSVSSKIAFGLDTENSWEITCQFVADDSYREAYNEENGTNFKALPEGSYSFENEMTLSAGTTNAELSVAVNGQLEPGDYMLPVRINSVSMFELSSNNVYFWAIRVLGPELVRTDWTIEANTEEPSGEGAGQGVPECALDGDLSTYWHSSWQTGGNTAFPHWLVIDTKISHTFTQFGLVQRQHADYRDTRSGNFYVSDDGEDWTKVGTFTMEKILTTQNFTLETPAEGRYFKVEITEGNRELNSSLSEIYAYGFDAE
ncbi:DUF1735 domain-containing protein [uncultured Bacteroides sp.]|uniref:BT_3987 domain-containing protein n=1 Tax=uncultured Bacteroides sp. TaxID=162156 RepID=UPI002675224C|nr:DUF1735 domain-containing protein [uncultured Bacteroides sp.]